MDVDLLVKSRGGNPNVYQIDGKDLIDIGNNSLKGVDFDAEKVDKIAISDYDWENVGQLYIFPLEKDEAFPKKSEMADPTIISVFDVNVENKFFPPEIDLELDLVQQGDEVELSGYEFKVIKGEKTAAYYNQEHRVLFSGNLLESLEDSELSSDTLEEMKGLEVERIYPASGKPVTENAQEYLDQKINGSKKKDNSNILEKLSHWMSKNSS
jgi:hypothetical protein